jgi:hypothetical protein
VLSISFNLKDETYSMPQRTRQHAEGKKRVAPVQGSVSRDQRNGTVTVSLRVPAPMLKEVDKAVKARPYKMPRHMWLLEAIHEKLQRVGRPEPAEPS